MCHTCDLGVAYRDAGLRCIPLLGIPAIAVVGPDMIAGSLARELIVEAESRVRVFDGLGGFVDLPDFAGGAIAGVELDERAARRAVAGDR